MAMSMDSGAAARRAPASGAGLSASPQVLAWARAAQREGCLLTAMAFYRQGLAQAFGALHAPVPAEACAAMDELVACSDGLAALNEAQGRPDMAAEVLGELHRTLLRLVCSPDACTQRRQAALWHSHASHSALMALAQAHGWSPAIDAAVRAGCLGWRVRGGPAGVPH